MIFNKKVVRRCSICQKNSQETACNEFIFSVKLTRVNAPNFTKNKTSFQNFS